MADGALALERAGKLGEGFEGIAKDSRMIVGFGKDAAEAGKVSIGKLVGIWGTKSAGYISHDGSFLGRAQMIVEKSYRPGGLLTKGLNWVGDGKTFLGKDLPVFSIEAMAGVGRALDAGAKILPKLYTMPHGIHKDLEELGNPFHALFG